VTPIHIDTRRGAAATSADPAFGRMT